MIDLVHDDNVKDYSLDDWLAYLELIDPNKIELGLDRVREVAKRLDLLNFKGKTVIEVAGTNGKGSTAYFISNALYRSGISVGLYTSPHIREFTERITINNQEVTKELLCEAFCQVYEATYGILLTYFEYTTLACLYCFKKANVDVLVLEIGLGGRLDAVNIVDADIAVITSIGLDHVHILGDSIEKIAFEKAGIIKQDKEVVLGPCNDAIYKVIAHQSYEKNAKLYVYNRDFRTIFDDRAERFVFTYVTGQYANCRISSNEHYAMPKIPRLCVGTALYVLHLLKDKGYNISNKALCDTVENAALLCRMQKVKDSPAVYIDVAHNVQAATNLCTNIKKSVGNNIAVIGMLKDKDIEGVLDVVAPYFDKWYVASLHTRRGESKERLYNNVLLHVVVKESVQSFDKVSEALDKALKEAKDCDTIYVFGSFVTAKEALDYFAPDNK